MPPRIVLVGVVAATRVELVARPLLRVASRAARILRGRSSHAARGAGLMRRCRRPPDVVLRRLPARWAAGCPALRRLLALCAASVGRGCLAADCCGVA
eukprot:scaffold4064_cov355-Prasinococcus_capsulatus_cf.AAC.3